MSKPKAKEPGKASEQEPMEEKLAASSNVPGSDPQPMDPKAPSLRASGIVKLVANPQRILSYSNIVLLRAGKALIITTAVGSVRPLLPCRWLRN